MKVNNIGRIVGVFGEAYIQFELARRGSVVDAIGATANGIDQLAWKDGGPNMGVNVETRLRNERISVTLFKNDDHVDAMLRECKLRGVEPFVACVVVADHGNRGYLIPLQTFMARFRRKPRATTETIEFYRTAADEAKYDTDPDVIRLHENGWSTKRPTAIS